MKKLIRSTVAVLIIAILTSFLAVNSYATRQKSKYFNDLSNHIWAIEAIDNLYEYEIVQGTGYNQFSPTARIIRHDFAVILERLIPENRIIDNKQAYMIDLFQDRYYSNAVNILINHAIYELDYNEKFCHVNSYLSREECFFMLARFLELHLDSSCADTIELVYQYSDYKEISARYVSSIEYLLSLGLINGSCGSINPKGFVTRAEMAVLIYNVICKYNENYTKNENLVINIISVDTEYDAADFIWCYLRNYGYSKEVTAGILGNIIAETGLGFNIRYYLDLGSYYGMCMWSTEYFPDVAGLNLEGQCQFLLDTIKHQFDYCGQAYGYSYEQFLLITDAGEAARIFCLVYERPAVANTLHRKDWAYQSLELFAPLEIIY